MKTLYYKPDTIMNFVQHSVYIFTTGNLKQFYAADLKCIVYKHEPISDYEIQEVRW